MHVFDYVKIIKLSYIHILERSKVKILSTFQNDLDIRIKKNINNFRDFSFHHKSILAYIIRRDIVLKMLYLFLCYL